MRIPSIDFRVDEPLAALYPGREPFHFTSEGPGAALSGVSVFLNERGPHWHYVGYGLRPRFPFELTFRLAARFDASREVAPSWPPSLLLAFAEHVLKRARGFQPGHYLCFPEPWDPASSMRCGLLVPDPELETDGGERYLQIVGLHEGELDWVSGDGWREFVDALGDVDPLLVTSPGRPPLTHARPKERATRSGRSS